MKLLIIGADAVCPEYIFDHPENYPFLSRMANHGSFASYSAYVQKGYSDSYLSEMNWSSIHTGLSPKEHGIAQKFPDGVRKHPSMSEYNDLQPFWAEMNKAGYSVGLWAVDCCTQPVDIDGYVVAMEYELLSTPRDNRYSERTLQICEKDQWIKEYLPGNPPPRKYPQTLQQTGTCFNDLQIDYEAASKYTTDYHFQDALPNFDEELEWFYESMTRVQKEHPVDVMYFYTPTTDLIGHCALYKEQSETLVEAYRMMDHFAEKLWSEFQPENIVFLSDHGMINFKEMVKSQSDEIRHEAFAARDEVIWFENGYIAFEAMNGALLYTAHGLKGTFIIAGKDIGHKRISGMRTLDIYPCIMELMGIRIPEKRSGFVPDIFERSLINEDRKMPEKKVNKKVAIIQTCSSSQMRIVINEIYLRDRFIDITVVGEQRYQEIFENNPRVYDFIGYESFKYSDFDEVFCGRYNDDNKQIGDVLVYRK